jgi:hypothetical protein
MISASILSISGAKAFIAPAAPVHEPRVGDIDAHPGKDLVLPVEGHMIVELRDQDIGEQVRSRHGSRGIGRMGAGTWTIFSQRRQDFLMRARKLADIF